MTKRRIIILSACFALITFVLCACSSSNLLQNYRYKISENSLDLKIGDGYDLSIIGTSTSDVAGLNIEWSSAESKIAAVDESGFVVANSEGKTDISAHITSPEESEEKIDVTYICKVSVSKNGISLEKFGYVDTEIQIVKGQTFKPRLTVYPGNADNRSYTVTSSNDSVVKVELDGSITGVSEGTATVVAKTDDGSFETTASVIVSEEKNLVESFVINQSELSLTQGDTETLTATVTPSNLGLKVTWESSDSSIVSVNSKGVITARKAGKATITATVHDILSEKTAVCEVTVIDKEGEVRAESITLQKKTMTIKNGDNTIYNFGASIYPSTSTNVISWTSSNSSLVYVNSKTGDFQLKGTVSSRTTVTLTCRAGALSVTATVIVVPEDEEIPEITVTPTLKSSWKVGDKGTLTLKFSPEIPASERNSLSVSINDGGYFDMIINSVDSYTLTAKNVGSGTLNISVSSSSGRYKYVVKNVDFTVNSEIQEEPDNKIEFKIKNDTINLLAGDTYPGNWYSLTKNSIAVAPSSVNVTFSSSNSLIATVDKNGKITGVSEGSAKISVKNGSENLGTITVNVSAPEVVDPTYDITESSYEISSGNPAEITVSVSGTSIKNIEIGVSDPSLVSVSDFSGNGTRRKATVSIAPEAADYSGKMIMIDVTVTFENGHEEIKSFSFILK